LSKSSVSPDIGCDCCVTTACVLNSTVPAVMSRNSRLVPVLLLYSVILPLPSLSSASGDRSWWKPPGATNDPSVRMIGWPSSVVTLRLLPVPSPERDFSELLDSPEEVRNVPVCITCDSEGRTCKTCLNWKLRHVYVTRNTFWNYHFQWI
jgi:hypothetical protein